MTPGQLLPAAHRITGMALDGLAIVVPARNEEQLIARCLGSLAHALGIATEHGRAPAHVVTVVVVDSSDDRTEQIARTFAGVTVLTTEAQNVGEARRVGIEGALQLLTAHDTGAPRNPGSAANAIASAGAGTGTGTDALRSTADHPWGTRLWIANTDADSAVPSTWLLENLDAAARGADALLGTVRPDLADFTTEQRAIWVRDHPRIESAGHIHGANLGFRASAYLRAGGFSKLAEHEDVDLMARFEAQDARIVASARAVVLTSGRQAGRTPGGYAGYLRDALLPPG